MSAGATTDDSADVARPRRGLPRALRHRSLLTGLVICVLLAFLVFAVPLVCPRSI